jgi:hypothetical protein
MQTPPPSAAPLGPDQLAAPRWTDAFADRFGSVRALAASAACALLLGGLAARHVAAELRAFDEVVELTGPLWEIAS